MGEEDARALYRAAKGLGEARVKHSEAVERLVELAEGREELVEEALQLCRAEVRDEEATPDAATGDTGPPQAPALLAARLLEDALALVRDG